MKLTTLIVLVSAFSLISCGKGEDEQKRIDLTNTKFSAFITHQNGAEVKEDLILRSTGSQTGFFNTVGFGFKGSISNGHCMISGTQFGSDLRLSLDSNGQYLLYRDDSSFYGYTHAEKSIYGIRGDWSVDGDDMVLSGVARSLDEDTESIGSNCVLLKVNEEKSFTHIQGPKLTNLYGVGQKLEKGQCFQICQ